MTQNFTHMDKERAERAAANHARLHAVIEYVARQFDATNERYRGAVKLNKVLWWADTESHRRRGFSVTGSEYQRLSEGPAPHQLPVVRSQLEAQGRIRRVLRDIGAPKPEHSIEVIASDESTALDTQDREFLDEALELFRGKTGSATSEWSHRHSAGWQVLEDGDLIPHESWLIDTAALDEPPAHSADDVAEMLRKNSIHS